MIWHKCPKEKFTWKKRAKLQAFAICEYNFGVSDTIRAVQDEFNLSYGIHKHEIGEKRDLRRLKQNDVRITLEYKKNWKQKATQETKKANQKAKIGEVGYKAGEFWKIYMYLL